MIKRAKSKDAYSNCTLKVEDGLVYVVATRDYSVRGQYELILYVPDEFQMI